MSEQDPLDVLTNGIEQGFMQRGGWRECRYLLGKLVTERGDEIERLKAIVDKLPKTKDGVSIVPGMRVFYVCEATTGHPVRWSPVLSVSATTWAGPDGTQPYYIRNGSQPWFSTHHLAATHRADIFAAKARDAAEAAATPDDQSEPDHLAAADRHLGRRPPVRGPGR